MAVFTLSPGGWMPYSSLRNAEWTDMMVGNDNNHTHFAIKKPAGNINLTLTLDPIVGTSIFIFKVNYFSLYNTGLHYNIIVVGTSHHSHIAHIHR